MQPMLSRLPICVALLSLTLAGASCQSQPQPQAKGEAVQQKVEPRPMVDPQAKVDGNPAAAVPPGPGVPAAVNAREVTPSGELRDEPIDELLLKVPSEWTREVAASTMRKAEFVLPGPGGDTRLVVYRFPGGAGGGAKNIERWKGQIELKEGSEPITKELDVAGLHINAIDLEGAYAGQSMPGAPPQPPIAEARLLAAMIDGSGDAFYFKLVGPAATVNVWAPAWEQILSSLSVSG